MIYEQQDLFPNEASSPEVSPAKISLLLANVLVFPVAVRDFSGKLYALLLNSDLSGSSSKTSLVSCHQTEDETWASSSGRWASAGMGSPTECWTLSTSESPSVVVECSLSDVLETQGEHLQKYWLSPKACAGILRRATRRGRSLPEKLQQALESVAN
jgi:hypothetical protein